MFDVTPVGDWATAVDENEHKTVVEKDGIRTVTEYIYVDDDRYKVINTYKVTKKMVPREVAVRKRWQKFGDCKSDGPGAQVSTTYVTEEVAMQFTRNRAGEQILEDAQIKVKATGGVGVMNCRVCKSKDHWTVHCPYKEQLGGDETSKEMDAIVAEAGVGTRRYVAPGTGIAREDEPAIRITNLPLDYEAEELEARLRQMIEPVCGRPERAHVGRDKKGGPRGFAFVNFMTHAQAEKAVDALNGAKLDYVILKVELARESRRPQKESPY